MNGANHQPNDGPRELEIFSDEQVEEVMESLEYFKGKIEQLQAFCDQLNQSKMQVDESLLELKRKHHEELGKYQEEINVLRNVNIQLMAGKVASAEKRGGFSVSTLSCAIDAENAEARIQEMASKVRSLELTLAEKDKHVSVMEWQIMDLEATITTLQAERDQLVLELELHHTHDIPPHEPLGDIGGSDDFHGIPPEAEIHRRTKPSHPRRSHSDVWGNGEERLSLQQMLSLSAEWSAKDGPHMRRPPQRHFSDCNVKRDTRVRSTDFSRPNTTHSLEDFDNLSEVDSGLGLGKLTRTTNFCDILDADEYSNFHVADNRLSFTADSVLEERGNEDNGRRLLPLTKKWSTLENGLSNGISQEVMETEEKIEVSKNSDMSLESFPDPPREHDSQSLASSTSDFSSAFHSSQDILLSSMEEPSRRAGAQEKVEPAWATSTVSVSEGTPSKQKLTKNEISKSDSCISTTRSPPSDKEDMWNFTPDSVVNVSTGEILIPSLVETPASPTLMKSRSFTSSIEIVLKSPQSKPTGSPKGSPLDNVEQTGTSEHKSEVEGERAPLTSEEDFEAVTLRDKLGGTPRAEHHEKSKSACEASPSRENEGEGLDSRHKKSLSDPIKKADEKRGRRKLIEYQKWQKYGRRGKPPGGLKISDC